MASTDSVEIPKILVGLGVDEQTANSISGKMNGVDYLNLVNTLSDDSPEGKKAAVQILSKYGIKLRKVPQMDNTRLESIFTEMHLGKAYEDADLAATQHVRPISEMDSPAARMSGYSNFVRVSTDEDANSLQDWLEENEFSYQNNDKHTFLVQSADRDATYRLNHFMSKRNASGKASVMDAEVEEAKVAKTPKNIPASTPRNPIAQGIVKKSGGGVHANKDAKRDPFDRNAKHKKSHVQESAYTKGQIVHYGENEVPVHIPAGPKGSVGLLVDGKVKMVRETEINQVNEGVLGMTKIDPLYRLRELAGMRSFSPSKPVVEDDFGSTVVDPIDVADDSDEFDSAPEMGADTSMDDMGPTADFDVNPLGDAGDDDFDLPGGDDDLGMDDLGGMDPNMDDGLGDDMDGGMDAANPNPLSNDPLGATAGIPGDLPPAGAGANVAPGMAVEPPQSEAYAQILGHLNTIQDSLGDVKLSEYRSLVAKLQDMQVQIKGMGRDYLGEMRKLKN